VHRRAWFVRLSVHNFFKGLRSDGSVIETMIHYDSDAVAFPSFELANEVVKRLKTRDIPARPEQLTCERRQSTITTSLEEIGFNRMSLPDHDIVWSGDGASFRHFSGAPGGF